ncbi:MAG: diguanylate cyclase domain-containing protein [Bacillota bacterium]
MRWKDIVLKFIRNRVRLMDPRPIKTYFSDEEARNILDERETTLKLMVETANIGFFEWDIVKGKLTISDEILKILKTDKAYSDKDFRWMVRKFVKPQYRRRIYNEVRKTVTTGSSETIELVIVREDGEERWIRGKSCYVCDEERKTHKYLGAVQDITELKKGGMVLEDQYRFINQIIDAVPDPVFLTDANKGTFSICNKAYFTYTGFKREEVIGHTIFDIHPKEMAEMYQKVNLELLESKGVKMYETISMDKSHRARDVVARKAVLTDEEEKPIGIVGVLNDITPHKNTIRRIDRLLKIKEAMLEVNHQAVNVTDIHKLYDLILEKVIAFVDGARIGSVVMIDDDQNLKIVACKGYSTQHADRFSIPLEESYQWKVTNGIIQDTVIINHMDQQKDVIMLSTEENVRIKSIMSGPIINDRQLYGFVNIDSIQEDSFDETDKEIMEYMRNQIAIVLGKRKLYEKINHLYKYDKLTNIYNRRFFEESFEQLLKKTMVNKDRFSFAMFDLNGLKNVNDTYGHQAGDCLIQYFANRIKEYRKPMDMVARFGGDEFVGIFIDKEPEDLEEELEIMIKDLEENPIQMNKGEFVCSFSYGIALFPQDGNTYDQLVKAADEKMYEHKRKMKSKMVKMKNKLYM